MATDPTSPDPWPSFFRESETTWSQIPSKDRQLVEIRQRPGSREDDMSIETCGKACEPAALSTLPCHVADADLWFAENPADLEQAKALCAGCPIRRECLTAALEREEPWGVWGGEIFERGIIVTRKRPRGRPRKNPEHPAAA
jgi:WhiB family transcriptional regulator, redox-sensing transcriptional regulator